MNKKSCNNVLSRTKKFFLPQLRWFHECILHLQTKLIKNIFALISQSQSFLSRVAMSLQHDFKELENVALIKLEKVSCVSLAILNGMLNREVSEFAIN